MNSANRAKRISLSLAAFVLLCFFLPWVQLSCGGVRDQVTGFDLARDGDGLLWLIPVSMTAILLLGLIPLVVSRLPAGFAFAGTVGGLLGAYLLYRERSELNAAPRLVGTQWTIVFWLAFAACLLIAVSSFVFYSARSRAP